MDYLYFICWKI